ncbi:MAG: RHS repeat-associated core domain-containing protein [Bacteroidia bacterium]|nr:RHS repeat-associated core domain-containing protein [Bacteroidia bacterium]
MPGDTIRMEVYAKYVDGNATNSQALVAFLAMIANGAAGAGVVIDGGGYSTSTSSFPYGSVLNKDPAGGSAPMACLNYITFNSDYEPIIGDTSQTNFVKVTTLARETGSDIAHEKLSAEIVIKEAGYMYIYLSNDNPLPVEVFFDDFKVEHIKSAVVQENGYYAFGLSYNMHSREHATPQKFLYNGKELHDELDLDWLDYGARMYMPELGRWGVVDPLSEDMMTWSPYNYTYNNPTNFVDLFGLSPIGMLDSGAQPDVPNRRFGGRGTDEEYEEAKRRRTMNGFIGQAGRAGGSPNDDVHYNSETGETHVVTTADAMITFLLTASLSVCLDKVPGSTMHLTPPRMVVTRQISTEMRMA